MFTEGVEWVSWAGVGDEIREIKNVYVGPDHVYLSPRKAVGKPFQGFQQRRDVYW